MQTQTTAIRPTALARAILRKHGKSRIFTNLYEHCRTVKCYGTEYENRVIVTDVIRQCHEIGVHPTVGYTAGNGFYSGPATIFRFPL